MVDSEKLLTAREKINSKISESEDFCFSIINCKDRDEVKKFLADNGIEASDKDLDDLAKSIEEVSDICSKLSDDEMEKVVGGGLGDLTSAVSTAAGEEKTWSKGGKIMMGSGATILLLVMISGMKKYGKKKGWWGSNQPK